MTLTRSIDKKGEIGYSALFVHWQSLACRALNIFEPTYLKRGKSVKEVMFVIVAGYVAGGSESPNPVKGRSKVNVE